MVNKLSKYKKITFFISVLIIVFIIILQQSQNNSVIIDKIIKNNVSEKKDIVLSQKPETTKKLSTKNEILKNNDSETDIQEPQTYSVVAEEILYPNEYDFGDILDDTVLKAVGKPIKINTLPITKAKIGDTIELEFAGKSFTAEVFEIEEDFVMAEVGDNAEGEITTYWFDSYLDPSIKSTKYNQIRGDISYDKNGVVNAEIRIQHRRGDYAIYINKNVAYYVLENDWQNEFYKQGYKRD